MPASSGRLIRPAPASRGSARHDRALFRGFRRRPEIRLRPDAGRRGARSRTSPPSIDPQPFHLDEAAARGTIFGGLAASGWHTAAMTMRLLVEGEFRPAGGIIGAGFDEFALAAAGAPRRRAARRERNPRAAAVASRAPAAALVTVRTTTLNQNGEAVQVSTGNLVVPRRPPSAGAPSGSPVRDVPIGG